MAREQTGVIKCQNPQVDHVERHGYLFGYPIAHSLSPLFHQTIFAALGLHWDYFLLPSTDLDNFIRLLKDSRIYGSGVTMPNKVTIIPRLDDILPECHDVGACNTVFFRDGLLVGANTDVVGVRESFYQNVADPENIFHNRPALVIGGGGAARSAVYALVKFMRCTAVYLVNRDPSEVDSVMAWCQSHGYGDNLMHVTSIEQAANLEGPGAIVACVPNVAPSTPAEILARRITEIFFEKPHKGAILEMCYHPTPFTEIGHIAEKRGWQVILGTEAMIYQGFEQARLWTNRERLFFADDAFRGRGDLETNSLSKKLNKSLAENWTKRASKRSSPPTHRGKQSNTADLDVKNILLNSLGRRK